MKRSRKQGGFTLIEMLCALLIMVLLTTSIGAGVDAGVRIYRSADFQRESTALADILNTTLEDILCYSIHIREITAAEASQYGEASGIPHLTDPHRRFVFTSLDYGIQDAYFCVLPQRSDDNRGYIYLNSLRNTTPSELLNTGSYSNLVISDFSVRFSPRSGPGTAGAYFCIRYTICDGKNSERIRTVETIVRPLNP